MLIFYSFILGAITGIAIGTLIVVTLTFFRRVIEQKIEIIGKQIESVGPKPRGFLIEPESDADAARAKIKARNDAAGRPTKISELS